MLLKMKISKKKILLSLAALFVLGVISLVSINAYVKSSVNERILTPENAAEQVDIDCILVLGCLVKPDGTPSDMLKDRLTRGISLYNAGTSPVLLMSGDNGRADYNEVGAMKQYAIDAGIPSSDIFMDHAGFSTYESIYRAKEIFGVDKIIIVTQKYHLYRALYLAKRLGVEAYGVASDYHIYRGQQMRDMREVLARCKDFFTAIIKPKPTFLGTPVKLG